MEGRGRENLLGAMKKQKKTKKLFKKLTRFLIIFLLLVVVPLVLNVFLFSYPWKRIELGCSPGGKEYNIPDRNIVKPSFRTFLADSLQIPLNLRWYKIYVQNVATSSPGCIVKDGEPVLAIWAPKDEGLLFRSETSFVRNEPLDGISYMPDNHGMVRAGEERFFLYSSTEGFVLVGIWHFNSDISDCKSDYSNLKYCVQAQTHIYPWLTKLVVIFILWMFVISSGLTIWQFFKKSKR